MALILTPMTVSEITDKLKEMYGDEWDWIFTSAVTENGNLLHHYDDNDMFYFDGDRCIAVKEAREIINWREAKQYIQENNLVKDFIESEHFDTLCSEIMSDNTTVMGKITKRNSYVDYAGRDAEHYLEWLWSKE